jgi:hypothetical protein
MTRLIRPIRIEGDVAFVTLTQGYEAIIDAADVPLVEGWNWCVLGKKQHLYAMRNIINKQTGKHGVVLMHRVIMGDPDGLYIDHIDCDGINNQRSNLRLATHAENLRNQRIGKNNTSGFKGVTKARSKWRAEIKANGIRYNLGHFDMPEAAYAAYVAASAVLHGEFGRAA